LTLNFRTTTDQDYQLFFSPLRLFTNIFCMRGLDYSSSAYSRRMYSSRFPLSLPCRGAEQRVREHTQLNLIQCSIISLGSPCTVSNPPCPLTADVPLVTGWRFVPFFGGAAFREWVCGYCCLSDCYDSWLLLKHF